MKDIQKFCCVADPRSALRQLIRLGEYIYATNGHIAIRIPDDKSLEASDGEETAKYARHIDNFITKGRQLHFAPFAPDLPSAEPCLVCSGVGMVCVCSECDGDGEFDYGTHLYECKECDGSGAVQGVHPDTHCWNCDGLGEAPAVSLDYLNGVMAVRYARLIASLPGVEFAWSPELNDEELPRMGHFRFEGGEGALMPMRRRSIVDVAREAA